MYYHWLNMLMEVSLDLEGHLNTLHSRTIKQQYEAGRREILRRSERAMIKLIPAIIRKKEGLG